MVPDVVERFSNQNKEKKMTEDDVAEILDGKSEKES